MTPINYIKIGMFGLDGAGKTSIKRKFFDYLNIDQLKLIRPTIAYEISTNHKDFLQEKIVTIDFGGQLHYRNDINKYAHLLKELAYLIFVIDVHDSDRFLIAKAYLDDIWEMIQLGTSKMPKLAIFLHKYDITEKVWFSSELTEALCTFIDYSSISSFQLTSIYDSSSDTALLKIIILSLPEKILSGVFEENLLTKINDNLFPLAKLWENLKKNAMQLNYTEIMNKFRSNALQMGQKIGREIIDTWLNIISHDSDESEIKDYLKPLIIQERQVIVVKIPVYEWYPVLYDDDKKNVEDILLAYYEEILSGITIQMGMSHPRFVKFDGNNFSWEIDI